jgi:hypothetical protein
MHEATGRAALVNDARTDSNHRYPVREHNGMVWGYFGLGEPPALPGLDCFEAAPSHVFAFKGSWGMQLVASD